MASVDILYVEDIPKRIKSGVFKGKTPYLPTLETIVVEIRAQEDIGHVAHNAMIEHLARLEFQVDKAPDGRLIKLAPKHIILNGIMQVAPMAGNGFLKVLVTQAIFYVLPPYRRKPAPKPRQAARAPRPPRKQKAKKSPVITVESGPADMP